jgi:hypothetical protein
MTNYSATWGNLHKQVSHVQKSLSTTDTEIYTVTRSNFHFFKAKKLGQSFGIQMLCELTCEEV